MPFAALALHPCFLVLLLTAFWFCLTVQFSADTAFAPLTLPSCHLPACLGLPPHCSWIGSRLPAALTAVTTPQLRMPTPPCSCCLCVGFAALAARLVTPRIALPLPYTVGLPHRITHTCRTTVLHWMPYLPAVGFTPVARFLPDYCLGYALDTPCARCGCGFALLAPCLVLRPYTRWFTWLVLPVALPPHTATPARRLDCCFAGLVERLAMPRRGMDTQHNFMPPRIFCTVC